MASLWQNTVRNRSLLRLAADWNPSDTRRSRAAGGGIPAETEDLPYRVELWDESKSWVEQVLAVTASGSIGFAAYYAATREFPQRYLTLRHKGQIVSRWNSPAH